MSLMCSAPAGRGNQSSAAAPASRLAPVLHGLRHRQANVSKPHAPQPNSDLPLPDPLAQSQGLGKPKTLPQGSIKPGSQSQGSAGAHGQSQDSGELQNASQGLGHHVRPNSAVSLKTENLDCPSQDWSAVPEAPAPMPVKAEPHAQPLQSDTSQDAAQQQLSQQQQQQQHEQQQQPQQGQGQVGVAGWGNQAKQAKESYMRSVSQTETRKVEIGVSDSTAVLLQACLHRFVRPEILHRWVCSRWGPVTFLIRVLTSLMLWHTTLTCASKPGCLMSHTSLHTPDCKA